MLFSTFQSVLIDFQHRKLLSSLAPVLLPEQDFPEEEEWRKMHSHQHYGKEAMLILSGSHSVQLNGKTYLGSPNTLILVNSRESHDSQYYPQCEDSAHLWIFIRSDRMTCQADTVTEGKFKILFQYAVEDSTKAAELNRIWDAARNGMIDKNIALFGICTVINQIIFDLLGQKELKEHGLSTRMIAVMKVKNYIDNTLGRGCSIKALSELAGYSPVHLQRLFSRIIGMTIGEYINQVRLKSFEELKQTCPYKVIAENLGFSGLPAFCTWLKKHNNAPLLPKKQQS